MGDNLPELPEPMSYGSWTSCEKCNAYQAPIYSADQLRAFAEEAVRMEREAIFEEICKVGDGAFMQRYGKKMGDGEYRGVNSAVAVMLDTVRARMATTIRASSEQGREPSNG